MPYQPGPLKLQTSANVGIVKTNYDFAGDVQSQLGDLDAIPAGWDAFLADATSLMKEPSDPFPDVHIDSAMLTMAAYPDLDYLLGTNAMATALGDADLALGSAIGFAPIEAWIDTPGGFVPPAPAETLGVPVIPPGAIDFKVTGVVGASGSTIVLPPPDPGLGSSGGGTGGLPTGGGSGPLVAAGVTLTNTSQYGNPNFRVGDDFQVTATGAPGTAVYVYATLNGEDIGGGPQGEIGLDRQLVITGTMTEATIGIWTEQWWVGGSMVASFAFVVVGN